MVFSTKPLTSPRRSRTIGTMPTHTQDETNDEGEGTTTVRDCPLGVDMAIVSIDIDERHRFRMLELGLRRGTVIRVTQRSNFHGRVVAKGAERIALDGATAARIRLTRVEHPSIAAGDPPTR